MNTNYLYSVLNLYLNSEKNGHMILTISRNEDYIFAFNMEGKKSDVTRVIIRDEDTTIELLQDIISKIKDDSICIDDNYDYNEEKKVCKYDAILNNGRKIIFKNFTLEEINVFRNMIYNISAYDDQMKVELSEEKEISKIPYNVRLRQAGFSTYVTIFLVLIWLADIIVIALWIFKHISK
ncbi:MAG: hypothetical protein J6X02_01995 [Bacilli bacterium]|nr:hypothetical protein [Bacilli bacterium]